jgi:hypothetical protein
MKKRNHRIKIVLNDDELAQLDEMRKPGQSRPAYVRSLIGQPPPDRIASRHEALAILSRLARDGTVSAAIALERALRPGAGRLRTTTTSPGYCAARRI